jgi:hypothetical protein
LDAFVPGEPPDPSHNRTELVIDKTEFDAGLGGVYRTGKDCTLTLTEPGVGVLRPSED